MAVPQIVETIVKPSLSDTPLVSGVIGVVAHDNC